jgi:hypothetical protein
MPLDLRVAFVFTEMGTEMLCVLCDETFLTIDMAWVLKDGNVPVGYLCPECLVNPRRAAERARCHAAQIRSLAQEAQKQLPQAQSLNIWQLAEGRASHWDSLALRIEKLDSWKAPEDSRSLANSP